MIILSFSLTAIALLPPGAPATGLHEPFSARIEYGDIDLGTPDGKAEFSRRVDHAASRVCGDWPVKVTLSQRREIEECKKRFHLNAAREIVRATGGALASAGAKTLKL